jgi:hypothetical protein
MDSPCSNTTPSAESNKFIILEKYSWEWKVANGRESEGIVDKARKIHND